MSPELKAKEYKATAEDLRRAAVRIELCDPGTDVSDLKSLAEKYRRKAARGETTSIVVCAKRC